MLTLSNIPNLYADEYSAYYAQGANYCSRWTQVRSGNDGQSIVSQSGFYGWFQGYISAHNILLSGNNDILSQYMNRADGHSLNAWLDKYCRDNPLKNYKDAVVALIKRIDPAAMRKRTRR